MTWADPARVNAATDWADEGGMTWPKFSDESLALTSPSAIRLSCATSPLGTAGSLGRAPTGRRMTRFWLRPGPRICRDAAASCNNPNTRDPRRLGEDRRRRRHARPRRPAPRRHGRPMGRATLGCSTRRAAWSTCAPAEVRAHRADDYMTKITAVAPGGACPTVAPASSTG